MGKQLRSAPQMLHGNVSHWGLHMGRGFLGLADEGSPDAAVTAGSTPLPSQCPWLVAQNPSVSGSKSCPPRESGKLFSLETAVQRQGHQRGLSVSRPRVFVVPKLKLIQPTMK